MDSADGNVSWMGGMDASVPPHLLSSGKYHRGCNVVIEQESGRLRTRYGLECVKLIGNEDAICAYNNGKNFQAEGYYQTSSGKYRLVRLVDGWILEFVKVNKSTYKVDVRNADDRRNAYASKGWITTVPRGVIINDGKGLPHIVREDSIRRSNPEKNEITAGRMGVYVQNRYFYVDTTGKFIWASDFRNPESLQEAKDANIWGFMVPDDQDSITAIGNRRQSLNYVEGGALIFSTHKSTYSVDVRGDRQNWEESSTNAGKVQESLPGIGAVSSYSYESVASNVYFRSFDGGIMDLYAAADQFAAGQAYSSSSNEIMDWLSKDTKRALSKCYTRKHESRLLTTVGARLSHHGYIFWSGMVSMQPAPTRQGQRIPTVYEGLFTGVRPWCMTSYQDEHDGDMLFIDSYDEDGQTRLYQLNVKLNHDINHLGKKVEIESWLETKSYHFNNLPEPKKIDRRTYTLDGLERDLRVVAMCRSEGVGMWQEFFNGWHYVPRYKQYKNALGIKAFKPVASSQQSRISYSLPKEKDAIGNGFSGLAGENCYSKQYRFHFYGFCYFDHFILKATKGDSNNAPSLKEVAENQKITRLNPIVDYSYSIATKPSSHAYRPN